MTVLCTGSIARSATRLYLSYSDADFEVFRPAGATRCTDGVKVGMEEGTEGLLPHAKFTQIGVTIRYRTPKTEIFTQI